MATIMTLTTIREEAEANIIQFNEALDTGDKAKMTALTEELKKIEERYAKLKSREEWDKLKASTDPYGECIKIFDTKVIGHKDEKDKETGLILRRTLHDKKTYDYDLAEFADYCGFDKRWIYSLEKFNQLLFIRAWMDIGLTADEAKEKCDSYYISDIAKRVELGETPTSNTQILKQLQTLVDEVFPPVSEDKHTYKVTSHQVGAMNLLYTREGKGKLDIELVQGAAFRKLFKKLLLTLVTSERFAVKAVTPEEAKKAEDESCTATEKVDEKSEESVDMRVAEKI